MSHPVPITVKHDGLPIRLTLRACRVYMGGEFAGNVEVDVVCQPGFQTILEECVRLQNSDRDGGEEVIASGSMSDGVTLAFHSEAIEQLPAVPGELTLLWDDSPIACLEPTLTDSVPIARHHSFVDPDPIHHSPESHRANSVRLVANRESMWLVLGGVISAAGALLGFAPPALVDALDPVLRPLGAGCLIALGLVVGIVGSRIPRRQVWYQRDERRFAIVEGRSLARDEYLSDAATHRRLDEFSHVRIVHRGYARQHIDDNESEEWLVSLEGPIPYACEAGVVHRRGDALELERFGSESAARRLAARVAHDTGLPVLAANDGFV